jgi:hypothetical protein
VADDRALVEKWERERAAYGIPHDMTKHVVDCPSCQAYAELFGTYPTHGHWMSREEANPLD